MLHSTNIQLTGQFVAGRIRGVTTSISMEIDPTNPTSYTLLLGVLMWDTSVCSHTNQTCKVYMVSQYAPQAVHAPPPSLPPVHFCTNPEVGNQQPSLPNNRLAKHHITTSKQSVAGGLVGQPTSSDVGQSTRPSSYTLLVCAEKHKSTPLGLMLIYSPNGAHEPAQASQHQSSVLLAGLVG